MTTLHQTVKNHTAGKSNDELIQESLERFSESIATPSNRKPWTPLNQEARNKAVHAQRIAQRQPSKEVSVESFALPSGRIVNVSGDNPSVATMQDGQEMTDAEWEEFCASQVKAGADRARIESAESLDAITAVMHQRAAERQARFDADPGYFSRTL